MKFWYGLHIGGLAAVLLALGATDAAADPISTLIVTALGLTGAAATVGAAVLNIGAAVGLSALSQKMRKKKSSGLGGANLSLRIETDAPRQVIFGKYATAGSLAYWQCTGANNQILHMVIALADHECDGLESLWVDGKERAWNSGTGVVDGFNGKLKVRFYRGTSGQTVDTVVRDASGGRWTNDEVGACVCYAVVEATQDEAVFKGGIPQIVFVVRGARLYDPRKDSTAGGSGAQRWDNPSTWVWSDNNAVVIYNVLRSISPGGVYLMGLNAPADTIRMAEFEAAANACDELVPLAGGGTEKRYRCGFMVDIAPGLNPEREALDLAMEAMAGDVICAGGIYRIMAGVARTSVATLTDEDFIVTEPLVSDPRRPRSELTNAIAASFSDPSRCYAVVPLPVRRSSADEAADGGYQWTRGLDLSGVESRTQGQRVQEVRRREARRQLRANGALRARWFILEPGDWVTANSSRRGWSGRTFQIGATRWHDNLVSSRELIEVDSEIDDWSTSDEIADEQAADLPGGGPTLTAVSGWSIAVAAVSGASGQQAPHIFGTYTPITDPTVTQLEVEYRKVGDTASLIKTVLDPSAGSVVWSEGVQGGIVYEARIRPVTMPERAVDWTAWASTEDEAPVQIVGVAQIAEDVTPGIIDADDLDEQSRFLLQLAALSEEANYGVAHAVAELRNEVQTLGEAVLSNRIESNGTTANARTAIRLHQTLSESYASYVIQTDAALEGKASAASMLLLENRVTDVEGEIEAQAAALLAAEAEIDGKASASSVLGLTSRVEETEEGLYYAEQAAYLALTNDGHVTGLAGLYGDGITSQFIVLADKFAVAHPSGSYAHNPFVVATNAYGAGLVSINGDLLASGTVRAEAIDALYLSALSSDLGSIRAGDMESFDGKVIFDLNNKIFQMDFD